MENREAYNKGRNKQGSCYITVRLEELCYPETEKLQVRYLDTGIRQKHTVIYPAGGSKKRGLNLRRIEIEMIK